MKFSDEDVARLATYITGHQDATPDARHLAATRAVLGGLAREGLPAVVAGLFGGVAEEGRRWYRTLSPDGELWCETGDPDEAVRSVEGKQDHSLQRLPTYIVRTPWESWSPTEQAATHE